MLLIHLLNSLGQALDHLGRNKLSQFYVKCLVLSWAEKAVKHGVKDFDQDSSKLMPSNTLEKWEFKLRGS